MNIISIDTIIFSLPIIFMLHDFEEIIMVNSWQQKYNELLQNSIFKPFSHWNSTASGSIAVLIEFLILILISFYSIITKNYLVWYGAFFIFTFHFIFHYFISFRFHHYTPGVSTSILFMPLCIYILYIFANHFEYKINTLIITSLISLLIFIPFFRVLTKNISTFEKWLLSYSKKTY